MAADANSYDAWFRMKVKAALEAARAGTSQVQVMQAAQALIDAKRQTDRPDSEDQLIPCAATGTEALNEPCTEQGAQGILDCPAHQARLFHDLRRR